MAGGGSRDGDVIEPALSDLARQWVAAVRQTGYLDLGADALQRRFAELTGRLAEALRREPFDPSDAEQVGAAIVGLGLTSPEALRRSVAIIARLPALLDDKPDEQRAGELLGALAAGFARAGRQRVLDDQERIRRAWSRALADAEHSLQRELHHQAHHDPLTGLPNRVLLYRHLSETVRDAHGDARIGVCFLDLDEFKTVNDTLGHGSGDRLLVALADRLRVCVNGAGHFVARVGGDEFVVVAADTAGPDDMTELAEAMLAELAKPVRLDGHELAVSASIGIVEQPARGADPEELLRSADATLYLAKADGRARYAVFDATRNAEQRLQYGLTGRLAGALERGEFELLYQPLVSLVDNRLRGAEALLRWRHPELGTVSPNTFIPVAEQSGMIHALGRWVLHESCRAAAAWDEPLLISVNVSPRQCTDPRLLDDVEHALAESGLPPSRLQLELTETVLMQSTGRPVQTLRRIADLGVRIVIDDFGIGYSNLAYLRHLPVHGLKLAGAFMAGIRSLASDHVDEQIVETVIRLAHTLQMTVTAEGIETADQAARLATLGCDLGQGWHFGRPVPPAGIPGDRA
ncbi:bifunctional diguanylate cyclase/phosphodiesterase [Dactylosporangium sp. AC04546]|uniref:putative bifunctional diguanylate cyclase/phosphodiesterase n=1 Tax=Dactylosporangium sp. AC04546 TaxID=2862460 RepID=UPI001EE071CD|nr:bifunctional diguanylate cyclase/phosphodiesterase [Dactylosporangium sp. AC04546]WVK82673.1 bifunctional diguanylate cyclase/phosphodiesterase [Dactylosporangium sp. AC04546]